MASLHCSNVSGMTRTSTLGLVHDRTLNISLNTFSTFLHETCSRMYWAKIPSKEADWTGHGFFSMSCTISTVGSSLMSMLDRNCGAAPPPISRIRAPGGKGRLYSSLTILLVKISGKQQPSRLDQPQDGPDKWGKHHSVLILRPRQPHCVLEVVHGDEPPVPS